MRIEKEGARTEIPEYIKIIDYLLYTSKLVLKDILEFVKGEIPPAIGFDDELRVNAGLYPGENLLLFQQERNWLFSEQEINNKLREKYLELELAIQSLHQDNYLSQDTELISNLYSPLESLEELLRYWREVIEPKIHDSNVRFKWTERVSWLISDVMKKYALLFNKGKLDGYDVYDTDSLYTIFRFLLSSPVFTERDSDVLELLITKPKTGEDIELSEAYISYEIFYDKLQTYMKKREIDDSSEDYAFLFKELNLNFKPPEKERGLPLVNVAENIILYILVLNSGDKQEKIENVLNNLKEMRNTGSESMKIFVSVFVFLLCTEERLYFEDQFVQLLFNSNLLVLSERKIFIENKESSWNKYLDRLSTREKVSGKQEGFIYQLNGEDGLFQTKDMIFSWRIIDGVCYIDSDTSLLSIKKMVILNNIDEQSSFPEKILFDSLKYVDQDLKPDFLEIIEYKLFLDVREFGDKGEIAIELPQTTTTTKNKLIINIYHNNDMNLYISHVIFSLEKDDNDNLVLYYYPITGDLLFSYLNTLTRNSIDISPN